MSGAKHRTWRWGREHAVKWSILLRPCYNDFLLWNRKAKHWSLLKKSRLSMQTQSLQQRDSQQRKTEKGRKYQRLNLCWNPYSNASLNWPPWVFKFHISFLVPHLPVCLNLLIFLLFSLFFFNYVYVCVYALFLKAH